LTELTILYTIALLPSRRIYLYSLLSLRERQVHRGLFLEIKKRGEGSSQSGFRLLATPAADAQLHWLSNHQLLPFTRFTTIITYNHLFILFTTSLDA
jgi:hypothetical protein